MDSPSKNLEELRPENCSTVEAVAQFTKNKVMVFRKYPSKKASVIEDLAQIYSENAEGWKIVIDMGKFRNGVIRLLGVKGMRALKKLLYELDREKYQKIDFGVED